MNKVICFINSVWEYILYKIKGEFIIAFIAIYHFVFPIINLTKAVFNLKISAFVFIFLLFTFFFIYIIFRNFPSIYKKFVKFLFNDFFTTHKNVICLGGFLIRDHPFIFGCYIFLSSESFLYFKENSNILWIYILYRCCVFFRNIFIVSYLGYNIIITLNTKKIQLLRQKGDNDNKIVPLFSNICLVNDLHFCFNYLEWAKFLIKLKPSLSSIRKTSKVTLPTLGALYINYYYQKFFFHFFQTFLENKKKIDNLISTILQDKTSTFKEFFLLKKIAHNFDTSLESFSKIMAKEINTPLMGFHYFLNKKKLC